MLAATRALKAELGKFQNAGTALKMHLENSLKLRADTTFSPHGRVAAVNYMTLCRRLWLRLEERGHLG